MNTARSNCHGTPGPRRPSWRWLRYALPSALLLVAASALAQKENREDALVRRYPFDPACPFGRISNGKGMIVRCIAEDEAQALLKRSPAPSTPDPAPLGSGGATTAPGASAAGGAASSAEGAETGSTEGLEVTVGPIVADQGELSVAKLAQPKTRYARCVQDHGGLKDRTGEVHVRFLVRSKGIAEGVSVHKRVNVSAETARCVADIVDRRRVGTPDAPLVGATVVVKFDKIAK